MKALISFTTLLIFTHAVNNHLITTEAKDGSDSLVYDVNGDAVLAGEIYYITAAVFPTGGGGLYLLNTSSFDKTSCNYAVGQEQIFYNRGNPLTFSADEEGGPILQSTDLKIAFIPHDGCGPSVWKVDEYDPKEEKYFIVTGGLEAHPGPETVGNRFKIEKVESYSSFYKITFCTKICNDVGVVVLHDVTKRRLALVDTPLLVVFQKASVNYQALGVA